MCDSETPGALRLSPPTTGRLPCASFLCRTVQVKDEPLNSVWTFFAFKDSKSITNTDGGTLCPGQ
jgi:hypothetical protein